MAITPDFARFLYRGVGYPWNWTRRVGWSYAKWASDLADGNKEYWVAYVTGTVAGYFELVNEGENGVEVRQFGIFPSFTGRGLGGRLLCDAVERGRTIGSGRVWLHTCTADHPHALANYRRRGLQAYKEEESTRTWKPAPNRGPVPSQRRSPGYALKIVLNSTGGSPASCSYVHSPGSLSARQRTRWAVCRKRLPCMWS